MHMRIAAAILLISVTIILSCATGPKKTFRFTQNVQGPVEKFHTSKDLIDREKTAEIFFRLEKPVDRIHVAVKAVEKMDDFNDELAPCKTFFIVEKAIDVTRFQSSGTARVYTELARNYTTSWEREQEIDVLSIPDDPILTLEEKSLYRIRFTVFTAGSCTFDVSISSDCQVIFLDSPPAR